MNLLTYVKIPGVNYLVFLPSGTPQDHRWGDPDAAPEHAAEKPYINTELGVEGKLVHKWCFKIENDVPIVVDPRERDMLGNPPLLCDYSPNGDPEIRKACYNCDLFSVNYLWRNPGNGRLLLPYIHK